MIKTFEQFVSAKYGKPVNEGFQSSKLREIIKQHGLPKNDLDKKMLYDIKDSEIVDIVADRKEYDEKYSDNEHYYRDEATFMIELEDGSCLVIGNLNILKSFMSDIERSEFFKKKHSRRHKGNLGKYGGDDIHNKHLEKVSELEQKRFAAEMQPMIPEIVEAIKAKIEEFDSSEFEEEGNITKEFDITLSGEKYGIIADFEVEFSKGFKKIGISYYDIICNLKSFDIWKDDGDKYTTNEMLGITKKTYGDLFKSITIDIDGEIYDYYSYHGVSRSDFY